VDVLRADLHEGRRSAAAAPIPPRPNEVDDTDIRSGVLPSWEPTEQPDASNAFPQLGSQEGIMCRLHRKCSLFRL
jgi:hypothetical protein